MTKKMMVIMDEISCIKPEKDTTLAILLEAKKRSLAIFYARGDDLTLVNGRVKAYTRKIDVFDDKFKWHEYLEDRPLVPIDSK